MLHCPQTAGWSEMRSSSPISPSPISPKDQVVRVRVTVPELAEGVTYQLATWLVYNGFDPRPYPALMAVLEREGVDRPSAVRLPGDPTPAGRRQRARTLPESG